MTFSLTWLLPVLENSGLKVAPVAGWQDRGRGEVSTTLGIICHHTAGRRDGNMPSLRTLIEGRGDLAGPLAQLGLGRDGTYYVIAAGRSNHAGPGIWKGITTGNMSFIGIEAENTGLGDDSPWPAVQMDAYARGAAAILAHIRRPIDFCIGHKEWAPGLKPDPSFEMKPLRERIAAILSGAVPHAPIPAVEPAGVGKARSTLRRGAMGDLVRVVQQRIRLADVDGLFGAKTEASVRVFQRENGLVPDGIVGPKTWVALDSVPA
jgi:peptidoglycan hydrolase-like protein with peptidoglycan-binding domain